MPRLERMPSRQTGRFIDVERCKRSVKMAKKFEKGVSDVLEKIKQDVVIGSGLWLTRYR